jgi:hypothetical protein
MTIVLEHDLQARSHPVGIESVKDKLGLHTECAATVLRQGEWLTHALKQSVDAPSAPLAS